MIFVWFRNFTIKSLIFFRNRTIRQRRSDTNCLIFIFRHNFILRDLQIRLMYLNFRRFPCWLTGKSIFKTRSIIGRWVSYPQIISIVKTIRLMLNSMSVCFFHKWLFLKLRIGLHPGVYSCSLLIIDKFLHCKFWQFEASIFLGSYN